MIAEAHFSRSEAFADDLHLDADETLVVPIDLSQGQFVVLTYENLTDGATSGVAWFSTSYNCWVDSTTGSKWSDVTIHWKEV